MSYTISDAKSDLIGILHGTNLSDVTNPDKALERAGRKVILELDPAETRRITNLSQIYDDVFRYAVPSDLKAGKIIDIRPQVNRTEADSFTRVLGKEFGKYKNNIDDMFSVRHNDGTKFFKITKDVDIESAITQHNFNSITANGTWSVGGDATNLTLDSQFYISSGKSLNFDLSGTSGYIENSDMTATDLSDHKDVGSAFLWVYLPDSSKVTNIDLRWGSSATAYWNCTVTEQHNGNSFRDGWNLLRFDWNDATETGSPDSENVDYSRITYNGTSETDIRVDNLFFSVGETYEVEYYSRYMFRNTSGVWSENITVDSDIVNLETDAYNIFLYEAAIIMAQQKMGTDATSDINLFRQELYGGGSQLGLYKIYKKNNPSETIRAQSTYYRFRNIHL